MAAVAGKRSGSAPSVASTRRSMDWMALLRYALLLVFSALCLLPILILALTALKTEAQIFDTKWSWFFAPTMANFTAVVEEGNIVRNLNNSVIVSIAATVLTLVFGTLAAYGLARFDFIGRRSFGYATLLLRTIPPAVLAVPVFVIWAGWHINDTLFGVTLIYVALNLPFTILLLYGFME